MKEDAMLQRMVLAGVTATVMALSFALAQSASPNGVKTLDPAGAIKAEGPWSLGARAGDFIFVAGMQGIDPATNRLVQEPQARIRQALLNIRLIAQSEGASLQDCVRLTVYVSDLHRFAPMVDKAQAELWAKPPYPPRTMSRFNACLTTISWRSTASSTPRCESDDDWAPLDPAAMSVLQQSK
jgi:2-iminobutanoate/2-iminopropanoate deaminase